MRLYYIYQIEKGVKLYRVQFQLIAPRFEDFCCTELFDDWKYFQIRGGRDQQNNKVSISINVIFRSESILESGEVENETVLKKISCCPFCGKEFEMIEQKNGSLYI